MKKFVVLLVLLLSSLSIFAQKQIFAKTIIFQENADSAFLLKQNLIKKVDLSTYKDMLLRRDSTKMCADTIICSYNSISWARGLLFILHSNICKERLCFAIAGVEIPWENMINTVDNNFYGIRKDMKKKEHKMFEEKTKGTITL